MVFPFYINIYNSMRYLTYEFVQPALSLILSEIYQVIPKENFSIFDSEEMEMILYGVPFIDLNEWKE